MQFLNFVEKYNNVIRSFSDVADVKEQHIEKTF